MRISIRSAAAGVSIAAIMLVLTMAGGAAGQWDFKPSASQEQALAAISADSLRGHLSFIASDLMQGRKDGTYGESVAAEYIASQFRRAGLKPVGDDGYFQTSPRLDLAASSDGFRCRIAAGDKTVDIEATRFMMVAVSNRALMRELRVDDALIHKVPFGGEPKGDIRGAAVITEYPAAAQDRTRRQDFLTKIASLQPALVLEVRRGVNRDPGYFANHILVDAAQMEEQRTSCPVIQLLDDAAAQLFDALPEGSAKATITLHLSRPSEKKVALRNVIGLLPGSDPKLSDTYILLTAHYDGTGPRQGVEGGWNAANDDGSGTVSVIEIASALSGLKERPRRSLVFMTFFGEEVGGLGANLYGAHPVFPLEKTLADVNLEQVGRTDSSEGDQSKRASLTGFDYSGMGEVFRRAGQLTGVDVYKHAQNSDPYFNASDNATLARLGVPAHTLCVAFMFPDYHGAGDTWQKINFENMALTDRTIATALLILAQSEEELRWNENEPKASRYLDAWKKLHGK
jgi:hypothetical protein